MPTMRGAPETPTETRKARPLRITSPRIDGRSVRPPLARETLVARAEWLVPGERELIRAVHVDGRSLRELAASMHVTDRHLGKRIAIISARLARPEFMFVVLHHTLWSKEVRNVAICCVLRGQTLRRAAAELQITYHTARRCRDLVLCMCRVNHAAAGGLVRRGA